MKKLYCAHASKQCWSRGRKTGTESDDSDGNVTRGLHAEGCAVTTPRIKFSQDVALPCFPSISVNGLLATTPNNPLANHREDELISRLPANRDMGTQVSALQLQDQHIENQEVLAQGIVHESCSTCNGALSIENLRQLAAEHMVVRRSHGLCLQDRDRMKDNWSRDLRATDRSDSRGTRRECS